MRNTGRKRYVAEKSRGVSANAHGVYKDQGDHFPKQKPHYAKKWEKSLTFFLLGFFQHF